MHRTRVSPNKGSCPLLRLELIRFKIGRNLCCQYNVTVISFRFSRQACSKIGAKHPLLINFQVPISLENAISILNIKKKWGVGEVCRKQRYV